MSTAVSSPGTTGKSLSTLENHSVPLFYACYLLRSKANGNYSRRTYVGSTPDPPRRIRQHNGEITQGALKTRFGRPWEMEAIVFGFPSKLAALQFEWAWQKAEISRHLRRPRPEAMAKERPLSYFPAKSSNGVPLAKIAILQRLLVVKPFARLTLSVQLFSTAAQEWWDASLRVNPAPKAPAKKASVKSIAQGLQQLELERGYPPVEKPDVSRVCRILRPEGVDGGRLLRDHGSETSTLVSIEVDDGTWSDEHLAKWDDLADSGLEDVRCTICKQPVDISDHTSFALCHVIPTCMSVTHLLCLSQDFLSAEASTSTAPPPLVPDRGSCPGCQQDMRWGDVARACYRRSAHDGDGGAARALRRKRVARIAKLKEKADGILPEIAPQEANGNEDQPAETLSPQERQAAKGKQRARRALPSKDKLVIVAKDGKKRGPAKKTSAVAVDGQADKRTKVTRSKEGTTQAALDEDDIGSSLQSKSDQEQSPSTHQPQAGNSDHDLLLEDRFGSTEISSTSKKGVKQRRSRSKSLPVEVHDNHSALGNGGDRFAKVSRRRRSSRSTESESIASEAVASEDEATDEEKDLAYAAAAEGSMEMAAIDDDTSSTENSVMAHARKISDASIASSAGKRKKGNTSPSLSAAEGESPGKRLRQRAVSPTKAKKAVTYIEISD